MGLKLKENLSRLMAEKKLNQIELSKLSGIPKTTIHGYLHYTSGKHDKLNITQIKKLAEVLKTDFHELLFGTTDPHSKSTLPKEILHEIFSGDVRVTLQRIERK